MTQEPRYITLGDQVAAPVDSTLAAGVGHLPVVDEAELLDIVSIRNLAPGTTLSSHPSTIRRVARAHNYRLSFRGAVLVAAVLATGALGTIPAASATTPKLVVKPAVGLMKGKVIRVTGSGFKAHDQVFLVECLAVAAGQSQCDIDTATPATITANGVLPSTKFKVLTGKIGNGTCGTKPSTLKKCVINAGNASGGDTATAPIAFKAPKGTAKK
jgi:hypothetical protein